MTAAVLAAPVTIDGVEAPRARTAELDVSRNAVELTRLWLATQRRPWRSLAVIPVGAGVPARAIADALADLGRQHRRGVVVVHDAGHVVLGTLQAELDAIAGSAKEAERTVVALPELAGSPAALAVAQYVDAAILCVALGEGKVDEASKILDEVGQGRVIGCVIWKRGAREGRGRLAALARRRPGLEDKESER